MELLKIENGCALLRKDVENQILEFEKLAKEVKEKEDDLKKAILKEMESCAILKVETEKLRISYVAPTDRETFDKKAFHSRYPTIYDKYVKMTPVKASVRVKVK